MQDIHILEASFLSNVRNKIGIAVCGREKHKQFATVFVYDVITDDTNRYILPLVEESEKVVIK